MSDSDSDSYNQYPSTHHSFDIELATELGSSDQAILMAHFSFWIKFNARKKRNFIEGRYWMYQTHEDLLKHFPYWTHKHLRTQIEKLVEKGYLLKGNFNHHKMDKTTWYAINVKENITTAENGSREPKTAIAQPKTAEQYQILKPDASIESVKKPYGKYVKLSDDEYTNLCRKEPKEKVDEIIEEINDHCTNNRPKGYTDYVAAFRTFLRNKNKTQGGKYGVKHKGGINKGKSENPTGCFIDGKRIE